MHGFAFEARAFVRSSLHVLVIYLVLSYYSIIITISARDLNQLTPEKLIEIEKLEKHLLDNLKLTKRPSVRSRTSASSKSIRVPAVMLHLQRAQETANEDANWFSQPELADRALILTGSANTVRSQLQVESGHSSPSPDLNLLVFNVSIQATETLSQGKFFLSDSYAVPSTSLHTSQNYAHHHTSPVSSVSLSTFHSSPSSSSSSSSTASSSTASSSSSPASAISSSPLLNVHTQSTVASSLRRITLLDVLSPPPAFTSEWSLRDLMSRSIDTAIIDLSQPFTWPHFDVTTAVQRWLSHPASFHALAIHMTHVNGSQVNQSHLVSSSSSSASSSTVPSAMGRVDPVLLTYSSSRADKLTRVKRRSPGRKYRRKGKRDTCRRHSLWIDFADVGWNDWIIAPPGYHAYVCLGECPYPLDDNLNTTNHAIIQTLVNSVNPSAVPKACCVPTELSPISMLYHDGDDKVVLKNYEDMVVEGCGCR